LLGGQSTPGIGFGIGLDRVALASAREDGVPANEPWKPVVVVVGADPQDTVVRLQLATELRGAGLACTPDLSARRLGKQLEGAARAGAHFAVICGSELDAGNVQLKDLQAGTQRQVAVTDLARDLVRAQAQHRHREKDDALGPARMTLGVLKPAARSRDWMAFVASRPEGDVLQCWAWGEAGAGEPGERWSRLMVVDAADHVRGIAQVLDRATSFGRTVLYVPHGPLWDREAGDAQILAHLLTGLRAHARGRLAWCSSSIRGPPTTPP
jgi:hypothetical protein